MRVDVTLSTLCGVEVTVIGGSVKRIDSRGKLTMVVI